MSYRLLKHCILLVLTTSSVSCSVPNDVEENEESDLQNTVNSLHHNATCPELSNGNGMRVSGDCQLAFEKANCSVSCELGFYLKDGQVPTSSEAVTLICDSSGRWNKKLHCVAQTEQRAAQNCAQHYKSGEKFSGVYSVLPLGYEEPFHVFCDMDVAGGGWTVFQRRGDYGYPDDYFFKTWAEYKAGFGNLRKEFWLGNDRISALTQQTHNVLRVDLTKMDGERSYAIYNTVWIDNEANGYMLNVSGYSGTAGDSLIYHSGRKFYTKDQDNPANCSQAFKGSWWYGKCLLSNLNGRNLKGSNKTNEGIIWKQYTDSRYSLYSEMKIRPADF